MFLRNRAPRQSHYGIAESQHRTSVRSGRPMSTHDRLHRRFNSGSAGVGAFGVLIVLGIIVAAVFTVVGYTTSNEHTNCVIAGKDRVMTEDGSQMRVYTENCGTFQLGDDWFRGNFTSADMYGSLDEGDTYNITATGFRIGILSMFPNIVKVEQVG